MAGGARAVRPSRGTSVKLFFCLLLAIQARAACELKVAAASDLRFPLEKIAVKFVGGHPGCSIVPVFGSSGTLATQIRSGAPFDLFLSADRERPELLQKENLAHSFRVYAKGFLVLWISNSLRMQKNVTLNTLLDPKIDKISIANPDLAPYGEAARKALSEAKLWDRLQTKLVRGENISQAAQFAGSGAVSAALLSKSLAMRKPLDRSGSFTAIDNVPPLEQAVVVLARTPHPAEARAFEEYLTSAEAEAIFESDGLASGKPR